MCTHIILKNNNGNLISARTMDFSLELDPSMIIIPRNLNLNFLYMDSPLNSHYGFMGLGKYIDNEHILADGINEHGLSGAALYFEGYAKYNKFDDNLNNLAPHELLHWILANSKSIEDILKELKNINIIDTKMDFLGKTPPLHWVFVDRSGESIIVEPIDNSLNIEENNIGVLTNSPDLNWHITNLRNYIGLDINQKQTRKIENITLEPFGQGSGSFGLPGDYTPPSRFVRTVFNKMSCSIGNNTDELVVSAINILNNVTITKGSVKTQRNTIDYTQYVSYMSLDTCQYFFKTYENNVITKVSLSDYDLNDQNIIIRDIDHDLVYKKL